MNDSKEALEKRREEIIAQLRESNRDVQVELDRDPEEQAIQVEHHDVSASIVDNLRRELRDIEEKLMSMNE